MNNFLSSTLVEQQQDVEAWLALSYRAQGLSCPADLSDQVKLFFTAQLHLSQRYYLCRLGDQPVACWSLHPLDTVIDLRDFFILDRYLVSHGPYILAQVVALTRERSPTPSTLTIASYPPTYSSLFLNANFKQNTRKYMLRSLDTYQIQLASIPQGTQLRRPRASDEQAVAAMTYRNYLGTVDQDMVCSSKEQAVAMTRSVFGREYCRFDMDSSFLVEDEQQHLIGNIFLGDMSTPTEEHLIQVVDISIDPAWRGKGLGKALLVNGLNAAKMKKYATIRLMVTLGNVRAISLYRSCGFRECGEPMYEAILTLPRNF